RFRGDLPVSELSRYRSGGDHVPRDGGNVPRPDCHLHPRLVRRRAACLGEADRPAAAAHGLGTRPPGITRGLRTTKVRRARSNTKRRRTCFVSSGTFPFFALFAPSWFSWFVRMRLREAHADG